MAQFAPVYMTNVGGYDEDGPGGTLGTLLLSANTIAAAAAAGTLIGNITGVNADGRSTLSIVGDTGRFALLNTAGAWSLRVGSVPSVAGTYPVSIRETNQYSGNSPKVTSFTITVT